MQSGPAVLHRGRLVCPHKESTRPTEREVLNHRRGASASHVCESVVLRKDLFRCAISHLWLLRGAASSAGGRVFDCTLRKYQRGLDVQLHVGLIGANTWHVSHSIGLHPLLHLGRAVGTRMHHFVDVSAVQAFGLLRAESSSTGCGFVCTDHLPFGFRPPPVIFRTALFAASRLMWLCPGARVEWPHDDWGETSTSTSRE